MSLKKAVTFGEIMMRLSTPGQARFTQADTLNVVYGGAEANVAISLAAFGVSAEHVTKFPNNDLGKAATRQLMRNSVITKHISYGEGRLGLYFLEHGAMQRPSRIIYDRFNSAFSMIKPGEIDWDDVFKDAGWFHWTGITPAISQGAADVCKEALVAARKHNIIVSGDINYRRNLWQYGKKPVDVMPALIELTDFVIAAEEDIYNCAGLKGNSFDEACGALVSRFATVKAVATTYRETVNASHNRLSGVLYSKGKTYQSREYDMPVIVDRIGGGDAYMAGLIFGWMNGHGEQETVDFGTAASVWKHSIEGDANLASVEEIKALVNGENGRLLR
jgi:2-dehydro-3-deoxygluconokinase